MRGLRLLSASSVVIGAMAIAAACSSSSSDGGTTGVDSGHPSDGTLDTNVDDTVVDTKKSDTYADSKPHDTGDGGACASIHPGDECNMVAQDCADTKQTCDYDQTVGHSKCVTYPAGTAGKGDTCDKTHPCDKGLFCYNNKCSPACCSGDNSPCGSSGGTPGTCNLDITVKTDAGTDQVIYNVCTYAIPCHPFMYDCPDGDFCLYDTPPDSFSCVPPSAGTPLNAPPGRPCTFLNDCGESQACFSTGTGGGYKCLLFCWLKPPDGATHGVDPKGRFAADGTCTVGGKSYGTCSDASSAGIGGGLGLCL